MPRRSTGSAIRSATDSPEPGWRSVTPSCSAIARGARWSARDGRNLLRRLGQRRSRRDESSGATTRASLPSRGVGQPTGRSREFRAADWRRGGCAAVLQRASCRKHCPVTRLHRRCTDQVPTQNMTKASAMMVSDRLYTGGVRGSRADFGTSMYQRWVKPRGQEASPTDG
jgi:hypothetical protein